MDRKLRMGMIGGGPGAFIGGVHRMAARLDDEIELVCGAFSADAEKSRAQGRELRLEAGRAYGSWGEMIEREAALPAGERMDFVSIVTPNHVHFGPAEAALKAGFHVVSDKPATFDLKEAKALAKLVEKSGLIFALTHNYTGYPMVKEARALVRGGKLGAVRRVVVEYPQGWLATRLEKTGQKQADWRTDPKRSGAAGCMGDIGTHAENLAEYVTGLKIEALCADLTTFVKGRQLEDDGSVLLRFAGGARGVLWASQIAVGEENALNIRVYGEKGGLIWHQQEPNTLTLKWTDAPTQTVRTGVDLGFSEAARAATRLPGGHPEGFIEAFANIYKGFAAAVRSHGAKKKVKAGALDFPTIADGVRGMAFIESVVKSSKAGAKWVKFPE